MDTIVVLHNIRSNENVGSIFRTADASGVSKIFLSGYTPAPIDKFGRINKALSKSALGAEQFVKWEKVSTLRKAIEKINPTSQKLRGTRIIAVEQDPKSKDYSKFKYPKKTAFVFGNEVTGITKKELLLCDAIIEIPMKGLMVRQAHHPRNIKRGKESLNVSVSAGIILFNLIK